MTDAHFANFIAGIRTGEKLHSPITVANVSVTMLQLSNIAWRVNRELKLDTTDRPHPQRSRSDEAVGPHLREGLGGPDLTPAHTRFPGF